MYLIHVITMVLNQTAVILEARWDVKRSNKGEGKTIKHLASAFFRGLAWIVCGILMHLQVPGLGVVYSMVLAFQYWLTFNLFHNKFAAMDWWHTGSGLFDSVLPGKENRWKFLGLRLALLLIFAYTYFNIYAVLNSR